MKVRLELDEYRYLTTHSAAGRHRWLQVIVGGQVFTVVADVNKFYDCDRYREVMDGELLHRMEAMLTKILVGNALAISPGTVLQD